MRGKKNRTKRPLKWNMLAMLVFVWLLPLALVSAVMFFYVSEKLRSHMEESTAISGEKAVELCEMRFADAVGGSRNASYLSNVRNSYEEYLKNQDKRTLYNSVTNFLNDQYRYNSLFLTTMLYFNSEPETIYYTNSNMKSVSFDLVRAFESSAKEYVLEESKSLNTGILFFDQNDSLYMARNMMTPKFQAYAVLIMQIDKAAMFKSLEGITGYAGYEVYIDGIPVADSNLESPGALRQYYEKQSKKDRMVYNFGRRESFLYDKIKFENHNIEFMVALDSKTIFSEQNFIPYLVAVFLLSMIPLMILVIRFFHREVTCPVDCLMNAAGEIEKGNLGFTLPEIGTSREFSYLGDSFNNMSTELKHQFETIYSEELALRDAKIMALQSQINPHFLNNTLEIINWEARMNGNYKVSGMIEALSTMLEATMNRSKTSFVPLSEELSYVEAYLYIVARRFEDKLEITREIDETLLNTKVPRLIIQPIVENAVEHGIDAQNRITITLTVRATLQTLCIEVKNHGPLTPEDEKKIATLLSGETDSGERSLNLGIRNVNQRLKILYGPTSGLTIQNTPDGNTQSTLTLKLTNN